jgi:hypothetical protein
MSEAARNDLYNGLSELLGPERAETLMSYLPRYDPCEVATRSDIDSIRAEIADLRSELKADIAGVRSELGTHGALLFGLQRTLIAGFITFGAALVGIFVAVL